MSRVHKVGTIQVKSLSFKQGKEKLKPIPPAQPQNEYQRGSIPPFCIFVLI